jgi:hypothetical protein
MKKFYKKTFFYRDPDMGTEFFLSRTSYYDLTIMMYDTQAGTFREYLIDFSTLREIYLFSAEGLISPDPLQNKTETMIPIVKHYVSKDKMSIIKSGSSDMYGYAVLGKAIKFQRDEAEEQEVLSLKRVAYLPFVGNTVLGIDTMALPREAATVFIDKVKTMFKGVDIELDLEGGQDAVN